MGVAWGGCRFGLLLGVAVANALICTLDAGYLLSLPSLLPAVETTTRQLSNTAAAVLGCRVETRLLFPRLLLLLLLLLFLLLCLGVAPRGDGALCADWAVGECHSDSGGSGHVAEDNVQRKRLQALLALGALLVPLPVDHTREGVLELASDGVRDSNNASQEQARRLAVPQRGCEEAER